jgi:hypothetical protein
VGRPAHGPWYLMLSARLFRRFCCPAVPPSMDRRVSKSERLCQCVSFLADASGFSRSRRLRTPGPRVAGPLSRCCMPRVRAMAREMRILGMGSFRVWAAWSHQGCAVSGPPGVRCPSGCVAYAVARRNSSRALRFTAAAGPVSRRCGGGLAALRGAGGLVHRAAVHRPGWLWKRYSWMVMVCSCDGCAFGCLAHGTGSSVRVSALIGQRGAAGIALRSAWNSGLDRRWPGGGIAEGCLPGRLRG